MVEKKNNGGMLGSNAFMFTLDPETLDLFWRALDSRIVFPEKRITKLAFALMVDFLLSLSEKIAENTSENM